MMRAVRSAMYLLAGLFLAGGSTGWATAPVVTIGTGTATSEYPFYTAQSATRFQMLVTAAEITAATGGAGDITAVAFNVSRSAATQLSQTVNLKMGSTTATGLTGFVSGLTTVFSGTYAVAGTGWQTFTLQTPFNWDGTSNVVIEFCTGNAFSAYPETSPVYATAVTGRTWGKAETGNLQGCDLAGGSDVQLRPNVQLTMPISQKQATVTVVTSAKNPSPYGEVVVFTATVTILAGSAARGPRPDGAGVSSVVPTGTVTFFSGPTQFGSPQNLVSGKVIQFFFADSAGSYTFTAVYSGDSNYSGSTSDVLTQTVTPTRQATFTEIISKQNPSKYPGPGSVSATVRTRLSSVAKGSKIDSAGVGLDYPLPTGTVTFYDGVTPLGTQTLSSSLEATLTISSLAVGSHAITAAYSGDDNYSGSTSDVLTQIVTPGEEVPTLSTWGLVALVCSLGAAGAFLLGRGLLAG